MGSKKITQVDLSQEEDPKKQKKGKVLSSSKGKKAKTSEEKPTDSPEEKATKTKAALSGAKDKPVQKKIRSKRYTHARSQIDKTKFYTPSDTMGILKRISRKNHPTLIADVTYSDSKFQTELAFPHKTGKSVTVAIADDKLLTAIEKGQTDFDILLATPDYMPRIAKLAKILGPKGLMPNPKNGTITPEPTKRKKELESGKITVRTEKNAPLIHTQIGKIDQSEKELLENLETLIKNLNPQKVKKLVLSTTMSPGIKVDLSGFETK